MPGAVLDVGAVLACVHGGRAQPVVASRRVLVAGSPALTIDATASIAGCPATNGDEPTPCRSVRWSAGATRVRAGGRPLALADSAATCQPAGSPLDVVATQQRVVAR